MKKTVLIISFLLCLYSSYSQPGELDRSFGGKGIVITDMGASVGGNTEPSNGILLQPDGSMYITVTSNDLTSVSKYHSDGSPDLTYGKGGYSAAVGLDAVQSVQQPDGKIIVVGTTPPGPYYHIDFGIVRFNTDGSLDSTFGGTAFLTFDFDFDAAVGVAIQNDGKIVLVGRSSDIRSFSYVNMKILRINTDGSLDQVFDTDDYSAINQPSAVALQSDGKIVVAGSSLWRYNADGTPDNSFDGDGKKDISLGSIVHSIGIQSNGKIVVAINVIDEDFYGFFLSRYNDDGSLDAGFGQGGVQTVDFGGTAQKASSMAIQTDNKIILGGYVTYSGNSNIAIARFDMNGNPDNSFSADGKLVSDFGADNDDIIASAIQNDGKLVFAGRTNNGVNNVVGVARFSSNGNPDNSLGGDGVIVLQPTGQKSTFYTSTAVQADGKAIAAGYAWNGSNYDFSIARYKINGALDQAFSGDGKQMSDFGATDDRAVAIAIQADGKIVVAGSSGNMFALGRYNSDGSHDNSFDGDGLVTGSFGASLTSLVIQGDGKIIVGGGRAVVRYNADGSIDTGFDGDGILSMPFDCNAIAIQANGKILVTGGVDDITVGRYNIDGSPDENFGQNGSIFIGSGSSDENIVARTVAVQPDGKIVIGGYYEYVYRSYSSSFLLTRLNSDGSDDNTFNGGSILYPISKGISTTMVIQDDGKIILGGASSNPTNTNNFTLARFTKAGMLDNTFNHDGIQMTEIGPAQNQITGIALSKDKLYAVGINGNFPATSGVITRYSLCACHQPSVKVTEFKAVTQERTIVLKWQVASEVALAGFTIERGSDSATFLPIGHVAAEDSNLQLTYSSIDRQPLQGINFYRLKMVDKDGKISFSNIISVMMNDAGMITLNVYPNPAKTEIYISKNGVSEKATIRIIDGNGRTLKEDKVFFIASTPLPLYINSLPKGLYILKIHTATNIETRRFIKE